MSGRARTLQFLLTHRCGFKPPDDRLTHVPFRCADMDGKGKNASPMN